MNAGEPSAGFALEMPDALPDHSARAAGQLRRLSLLAMLATTVGNAGSALSATAQMRWAVVDISADWGEFRQRFDLGLREAERLVRASNFAAASYTLEFVRRLVIELEQSLGAAE